MDDSDELYNPLDKVHLAQSIEAAMLAQHVHPLPPESPFVGAGIYALYYCGPYEPYDLISNADCAEPVYVGSALPEGGRTGGFGLAAANATKKLYARLRQHARSIDQAHNLELIDFKCRYLLLDDVWIPLGENYLISLYRPLWNSKVLAGFGIHSPGKGRAGQKKSLWDEVHPGRPLAERRDPAPISASEILGRVADFLSDEPSPAR